MSEENQAVGRQQSGQSGESRDACAEASQVAVPKLADIAADWGTSVPYVSKMKKAGCPVHSLEAARAWREEQKQRKSSPKEEITTKRTEETSIVDNYPGQVKRKSLRSFDASLKAAIEVEESAKLLVDQAVAAKKDSLLSVRIAAYNKAREGRFATEKLVQEILQKNRILVPLEEAKAMVGKTLGALFSRLRAVPRRAAPKANPTDDVLAEEVIREAIEEAIAEVSQDAALYL